MQAYAAQMYGHPRHCLVHLSVRSLTKTDSNRSRQMSFAPHAPVYANDLVSKGRKSVSDKPLTPAMFEPIKYQTNYVDVATLDKRALIVFRVLRQAPHSVVLGQTRFTKQGRQREHVNMLRSTLGKADETKQLHGTSTVRWQTEDKSKKCSTSPIAVLEPKYVTDPLGFLLVLPQQQHVLLVQADSRSLSTRVDPARQS